LGAEFTRDSEYLRILGRLSSGPKRLKKGSLGELGKSVDQFIVEHSASHGIVHQALHVVSNLIKTWRRMKAGVEDGFHGLERGSVQVIEVFLKSVRDGSVDGGEVEPLQRSERSGVESVGALAAQEVRFFVAGLVEAMSDGPHAARLATGRSAGGRVLRIPG
jgi:hypothetical protein